jgi:hypothetical protein
MAIKVYTKPAIISPEQQDAVDKVICYVMDNKDIWQRLSADLRKHVETLDSLVQEKWWKP